MPTQTFYNLPEEKRQKLLDAIHEELTRVPFNDVSINQIIRLAGIPRGSFYQYFEDKQDMLQYLMSDYREMFKQHALASLEQNGGDLFRMFLDIFDFTYAFVTEEKINAFFKNVFSDIRINNRFLRQQADPNTFGEFAVEVIPYINMELLDIRDSEDFGDMLRIILPLTGEAFAGVFFDLSTYERARLRYAAQLELLKRGFLKTVEANT
jgi:AcrR family transcriptional regulator